MMKQHYHFLAVIVVVVLISASSQPVFEKPKGSALEDTGINIIRQLDSHNVAFANLAVQNATLPKDFTVEEATQTRVKAPVQTKITTLMKTTASTQATVMTTFEKDYKTEYTMCNKTHQIALQNINLDFIWMEPREVYFQSSFAFLKDKRGRRLKRLERRLTKKFKTPTVQMVQVKDDNKDLTCLNRLLDVESFIKLPVSKGQPTDHLFLAAGLAEKYFRRLPTDQTTATYNSINPVLRVIALFAEDYADASLLNIPFMGNETDTCMTDYPSFNQLKNLFSDRKIDFLLVSTQEHIRSSWGKYFGHENHISSELSQLPKGCYPGRKGCRSTGKKRLASPKHPKEYIEIFLRRRVVDFACQRFQEHVTTRNRDLFI